MVSFTPDDERFVEEVRRAHDLSRSDVIRRALRTLRRDPVILAGGRSAGGTER